MKSPVIQVRNALEAFLREGAEDTVYRWRGSDPRGHVAQAQRHGWLTSTAAEDALSEAQALGLLDAVSREALRGHLRMARVGAVMAHARDDLLATRHHGVVVADARWPLSAAVAAWSASPRGRQRDVEAALSRVASDAWLRMADAIAEVEAQARPLSHPDAGPPQDVLVAHAEEALALTDEAAQAIVTWLDAEDFGSLLQGLRAQGLDGVFPAAGRWRRLAADTAGLGFERELGARVRVERRHRGISPRVRVVSLDPPRDVRLGPGDEELGLMSEMAGAEGLGRALAVALASAGSPVELRWPLEGTVPRALGTAFVQVLGEPKGLDRGRGIGRWERERVGRLARALLLLETRACAASVVTWAERASSHEARRELASERLRRALGVEVDRRLAPWLVGTPWAAPARLRGRLGGMAAWYALRERYDEDWYRNPRCAEAIRAGAHPGGCQSVESWLEGDLNAPTDAHRLRLQELADTQC